MKKTLLLFIWSAFAGTSLLAQPALTLNVLPDIGDKVTFYAADTNSITQGTAGANKTWNFANLQPLAGQEVIPYLYVAPSSTPAQFAANFPTSNYAIKIDSDSLVVYGYGRRDPNQFAYLGAASDSFLQKYSNTDIQLKPLSYNGSFQDDFANTTEAPGGFAFNAKGSRTVTYDAYGTLTTPSGTYQNAIRVKSVSSQVDSTDFGFGQIINRSDITTYDWFVANQPGALVSISYTHLITEFILIGFPPQITDLGTIKSVNYISNILLGAFDRPDELKGVAFSLAGSNPAVDQLRVKITAEKSSDNLQMLLTDINGRVIENRPLSVFAGENQVSLLVGHLAAGAYFLTLTDGQAVRTLNWQKQ